MRKSVRCWFLVALLPLLASWASPAVATSIVYSWTGTIAVTGESNPWGLPAGDSPFVISATVDSAAFDRSGGSVFAAGFDVSDAELTIGSLALEGVGSPSIDFLDLGLDIVTFEGAFTRNGVELGFATNIGLPASSFEFLELSELPPVFESVVTSSASGGGNAYLGIQKIYTTFVLPDTPFTVTVIPEPAAVALLVGALGIWRRVRVA